MKNVVTRFRGKSEKELNPKLLKVSAYYGFIPNVPNCCARWEKGAVLLDHVGPRTPQLMRRTPRPLS